MGHQTSMHIYAGYMAFQSSKSVPCYIAINGTCTYIIHIIQSDYMALYMYHNQTLTTAHPHSQPYLTGMGWQ